MNTQASRRKPRHSHGFTLIELLVVLVIIGMLGALIVPNVLNRLDEAKVTAARTTVGSLVQQLKLYKLDNVHDIYNSINTRLGSLCSADTIDPRCARLVRC